MPWSPSLQSVLRGLCFLPLGPSASFEMSQRHLAPRGALGLSSPMAADAEDTRKPAGAGQLTPHAVKLASMGDSSLRISSSVFLLWGRCLDRQLFLWPLGKQSCKTEQLVLMEPRSGRMRPTPSCVAPFLPRLALLLPPRMALLSWMTPQRHLPQALPLRESQGRPHRTDVFDNVSFASWRPSAVSQGPWMNKTKGRQEAGFLNTEVL